MPVIMFWQDFDEDMIPEDVKEVARNYSASVIKKRAGRVSSSPTLTLPSNCNEQV